MLLPSPSSIGDLALETAFVLALPLNTCAVQMWDINAPPPEELGEPYNIAVATNVLHTGANLAGAHLLIQCIAAVRLHCNAAQKCIVFRMLRPLLN